MKKILRRADTLEVKYAKRHEHDLDLFRSDSGFEKQEKDQPEHLLAFSLLRSFHWSFWLYGMTTLLTYSTFGPFFANISLLLRDRHNFSLVESGNIMALPSFVVCICFPLIGYISDKLN